MLPKRNPPRCPPNQGSSTRVRLKTQPDADGWNPSENTFITIYYHFQTVFGHQSRWEERGSLGKATIPTEEIFDSEPQNPLWLGHFLACIRSMATGQWIGVENIVRTPKWIKKSNYNDPAAMKVLSVSNPTKTTPKSGGNGGGWSSQTGVFDQIMSGSRTRSRDGFTNVFCDQKTLIQCLSRILPGGSHITPQIRHIRLSPAESRLFWGPNRDFGDFLAGISLVFGNRAIIWLPRAEN